MRGAAAREAVRVVVVKVVVEKAAVEKVAVVMEVAETVAEGGISADLRSRCNPYLGRSCS